MMMLMGCQMSMFFYLKKIRRLLWYESELFQRLKINYLFSHPKIFLEFTNRQCSSTCRYTSILAKCSEIDRRTEYRLYAFGLRQENINIYVMWCDISFVLIIPIILWCVFILTVMSLLLFVHTFYKYKPFKSYVGR